jgi:hypothetical protein
MSFLLGSMVACLLVRCTCRECSSDMVHHNCLDSLTDELKQTSAFCMIAHLYYDLYQGVRSVALPLSLSWLTRVLSTLPIPLWLGNPWCQWQGAAPRPTGAHFTPSKKAVLEQFVGVGDGKGSEFMHLLQNAPHSPSQVSPLLRLPL